MPSSFTWHSARESSDSKKMTRTIQFDAAVHGSLRSLLQELSIAREPVVVKEHAFAHLLRINTSCEEMLWWKGQAFVQPTRSRIFFHERQDVNTQRREEPRRRRQDVNTQRWEEPRRRRLANATCSDLRDSFMLASEEITESVPSQLAAALTVLEVEESPTSVNVWMGQDGVVSAGHYDHHHNAFLQLAHTKTWTIAPPTEALRLRPFPRTHPRDRQSQAGLLPPLANASDGTCATDATGGTSEAEGGDESPATLSPGADAWPLPRPSSTIILSPGDLLYLPPLYAHRVAAGRRAAGSEPVGSEPVGSEPVGSEPVGSEPVGSSAEGRGAAQLSISVNAFSPSHESMANQELISLGLPPSVGGTASREGADRLQVPADYPRDGDKARAAAEAVPMAMRTQLLVAFLRRVVAGAMAGLPLPKEEQQEQEQEQEEVQQQGEERVPKEEEVQQQQREEERVPKEETAGDQTGETQATAAAATASFLRLHLSSRWSPLYATAGCEAFEPRACPRARQALPDHMEAEASAHAARAVRVLIERTQPLERARGGAEASAVRGLLLIRYVELLSAHFLGEGSLARQCRFLRCLATTTFYAV